MIQARGLLERRSPATARQGSGRRFVGLGWQSWPAKPVVILACVSIAFGSFATPAATSMPRPVTFNCHVMACGMPAHGAYPHFVVGRVAAIANEKQTRSLFDGMRSHGHWSALPSNSRLFWSNLQPVAIDSGQGAVVITLTSQDEMRAAPLHVGDLVRYSPHRGKYEVPPADKIAAAYWGVDGCVAVLCRVRDHECAKRYKSGVYRTADGTQLSPRSLVPLVRGIVIDTETMVPRHTRS